MAAAVPACRHVRMQFSPLLIVAVFPRPGARPLMSRARSCDDPLQFALTRHSEHFIPLMFPYRQQLLLPRVKANVVLAFTRPLCTKGGGVSSIVAGSRLVAAGAPHSHRDDLCRGSLYNKMFKACQHRSLPAQCDRSVVTDLCFVCLCRLFE